VKNRTYQYYYNDGRPSGKINWSGENKRADYEIDLVERYPRRAWNDIHPSFEKTFYQIAKQGAETKEKT
jgi:hypothetical protein